jgi:PhnB protein
LVKNNILHATLRKGDLLLFGSDMLGSEGHKPGNNIALSLDCNSAEELQTFFRNLSSDGEVHYPLRTKFWGASFGVLTDKYGNKWMLNFEKNDSSS